MTCLRVSNQSVECHTCRKIADPVHLVEDAKKPGCWWPHCATHCPACQEPAK